MNKRGLVSTLFLVLSLVPAISSCGFEFPTQINILILGQSNATFATVWERASEVLASRSIGIYTINGAQGGTRLVAEPANWLPPNGDAYRFAMAIYEKHRLPLPEIDFILWHQGEGDARNLQSNWQAKYSAGLTQLITQLKADVSGNWYFVSALLHKSLNAPEQAIKGINNAIINHPDVDRVVPFDDLILFDHKHFESPELAGERWAQTILDLLARKDRE